ncbi:hypothetical protein M0802_016185 [Mischocyttarus mexicanus]|nr:hypothetical protein M0802_016185 [Mischocyttarus mexicanus]
MSESVKVAVRCRPMSNREQQQGCRNVVTIDRLTKCCTLENPSSTNGLPGGKVYQFDATFGAEASTELVYEDVGSVIVEAVLHGYNGTVFAYGQTGCGKSYTMRGFIERTLEHLFEATSTSSTETRYLAILSYLEIYNERLRDLLKEGTGDTLLMLKEDSTKGIYVAGGLREVTVKDAAECARLIEQGDRKRAAAATKMNAASSRSHAVLTLALEAIAINENDKGGNAIRRGRLHLVDLAGSERQTRTGATGDRLKEAASINLSLSALGNVISALAAGNGRHVPYRDSKLTRLLRDSLGGNARTLMIACISPSDIDAEETLSTLRYAARARCIKNKPIVNEDPKDALLRQYQLELDRLRKLLESSDKIPDQTSFSKDEQDEENVEPREREYNEEVEKLKKECESSNLSAQRLREELDILRSRYENINDKTGLLHEGELVMDELDKEREEKRRKKREAAKQEVLRRLEKLTIGGEALDNTELRKRREKRRKKLQALAGVLEASSQDGGVFQVYGQLRSTEDALKRMAKRVRQLEAEAADLQASWDAERRDLLRRELLTSQLCEAMIPHLRPGCPLRDVASVRASATWCEELNRWRFPDSSTYIPLPPTSMQYRDGIVNNLPKHSSTIFKADLNNNNSGNNGKEEDEYRKTDASKETTNDPNNDNNNTETTKKLDIVDTYFRRNRIDTLLARAREAKTFEIGSRLSKSGGSEDTTTPVNNYLQLNALNLQSSAPVITESTGYKPSQHPALPGHLTRNAWTFEDNPINKTYGSFVTTSKLNSNEDHHHHNHHHHQRQQEEQELRRRRLLDLDRNFHSPTS